MHPSTCPASSLILIPFPSPSRKQKSSSKYKIKPMTQLQSKFIKSQEALISTTSNNASTSAKDTGSGADQDRGDQVWT